LRRSKVIPADFKGDVANITKSPTAGEKQDENLPLFANVRLRRVERKYENGEPSSPVFIYLFIYLFFISSKLFFIYLGTSKKGFSRS